MFKTIRRIYTALKAKPIIEKEIIEAKLNMETRIIFKFNEIHPSSKYGVPVYLDQTMVRGLGFMYAAAIKPNEQTSEFLGSDRSFVMVDEWFLKLSPETQEALLYHEMGHINLGHMEISLNTNALEREIKSLEGDIDYREMEADDYAASVVGRRRMIDALEEMDRNTPTVEGMLRIKRLKKLMKEEKKLARK